MTLGIPQQLLHLGLANPQHPGSYLSGLISWIFKSGLLLNSRESYTGSANMFEDQLPPQQGAIISLVFTIVFDRSKKPYTSLATCNLWEGFHISKRFWGPIVANGVLSSMTWIFQQLRWWKSYFLTYAYICCIQMHSNGDLIMAEN